MLSNKQFDILAGLEKNGAMTQRALAGISGMSLGAVNKTVAQLTEAGMISNGNITEKGLEALEPYRVGARYS